jgi:hypothetical protein
MNDTNAFPQKTAAKHAFRCLARYAAAAADDNEVTNVCLPIAAPVAKNRQNLAN